METLEYAWLGRMAYRDCWSVQRRMAAARAAGAIGDIVLLVEHPPVFTMGRNGSDEHLLGGPDHLLARGAEYVEVDRGGSVTFHGPGQLVAYPIVQVARLFPMPTAPGLGDVVAHLRALEDALIDTVAGYGVTATVRPPYTGIWVGEQKLAAIGVKLASGVTTHGAALNVGTDLSWFDEVIPCGIAGAGVTSLERMGVRPLPALDAVGARFVELLATGVGRAALPAGDAVESLVGEGAPAAVLVIQPCGFAL